MADFNLSTPAVTAPATGDMVQLLRRIQGEGEKHRSITIEDLITHIQANMGDITLADDLVVGDDLTVTGDAAVTGTLAVTGAATATSLNGVPAAEGQSVDPSQKVTFFDDFLAAAIEARISSTAGAGTGNEAATTVASGLKGLITLKSASDNGTHAQNATTLTLDQLNFRADQGGLAMETRLKLNTVANAAIFFGFTDTISTTVEMPLFITAADLDSDAADACGIVYDTGATTDEWCHGGVKADADTVPAFSGSAPADDTFVILRVEVSAAGAVTGYINGTAIGAAVANAVTVTVALTPCIVVCNRTTSQRILTVDYIWVQGNR